MALTDSQWQAKVKAWGHQTNASTKAVSEVTINIHPKEVPLPLPSLLMGSVLILTVILKRIKL